MINFIKHISKKLNSVTIEVPDPVTGNKTKYLTRYYLFGKDLPWGNIYIHQFHSSDLDEELHNHPWAWGLSFIVSGGYFEQVLVNDKIVMKNRSPFRFNFIRRNNFHRVFLKENECWSIFMSGPRKSSWGFWNEKTKKYRDFKTSPHAIP